MRTTGEETVGYRLIHAAIKRRVGDGSVVGKPWELIDAIDAALTKAIADERERCAKIANDEAELCGTIASAPARRIAAAIRRDSTGEEGS